MNGTITPAGRAMAGDIVSTAGEFRLVIDVVNGDALKSSPFVRVSCPHWWHIVTRRRAARQEPETLPAPRLVTAQVIGA